jgi:hypothetical protein
MPAIEASTDRPYQVNWQTVRDVLNGTAPIVGLSAIRRASINFLTRLYTAKTSSGYRNSIRIARPRGGRPVMPRNVRW